MTAPSRDPLQRLSQAAARLGGPCERVTLSTPLVGPGVLPATGSLDALRGALAAVLLDLAARLEPALKQALGRASMVWDQMDAVTVMDDALWALVVDLRARWEAWLPVEPTAATEALLMLNASVGVVAVMEKRLATLVRLRLRDDDPRLMLNGRPFLDVAAALKAAGRAWV